MAKQEAKKQNAVYISDYCGHKLMDGKGKIFAEFKPFWVFDQVSSKRLRKGFLIVDDANLIKKIEAYPDFNKGFRKTDRIPMVTSNPNTSSIVAGVMTMGAKEEKSIDVELIRKQAKEDAAKELNDVMQKSKRYYELKFKLYDDKNQLVKGASDEEIQEFAELKILMDKVQGV